MKLGKGIQTQLPISQSNPYNFSMKMVQYCRLDHSILLSAIDV